MAPANKRRWNLAVVCDIRVYILSVCSAVRIVFDLSELFLVRLCPGEIEEFGREETEVFGLF